MLGMSSKKKIIVIFGAVIIVLNMGFVALYLFLSPASEIPVDTTQSLPEKPDPQEPAISVLDDAYYSIHFSYNDAVELCVMEAISRNSNLIQHSINELSSRFNAGPNMYLIMVDSHVGTPLLYDEKEHTCEIDPEIQGVAFYKEITRRTAVRPQ